MNQFIYSDKEKKLIDHFDGTIFIRAGMSPMEIYKLLAWKAFIEGSYMESPELASLRRICRAIENGKLNRNTDQWDNLITLSGQEVSW